MWSYSLSKKLPKIYDTAVVILSCSEMITLLFV